MNRFVHSVHGVRQVHSVHCRVAALLLFALALGVASAPTHAASADQADLAIKPDKKEALIGEPLGVTLSLIVQSQPEVADWPRQGSRLGDFEVLSAERPTMRKIGASGAEYTLRLRAACYDTGGHALGPASLRLSAGGEDGAKATAAGGAAGVLVTSDATTITIRSVLPADAEAAQLPARPVRPPVALPFPRWIVVLVGAALAVLALAVAGLIAWVALRLRAARLQPPPLPVPVDPDEEALRALAALETSGAVERDTADALYTRLSLVLRRYLGRRYRFDALDMTSGELLGTLERAGWSEDLWRLVRADLAEADSVKFARYAPPRAKRAEAVARVREIVMLSRPKPASAEPAAAPAGPRG